MSKPNLRRFKNAKAFTGDKDQVFSYLREELGNLISELIDGFDAITFEDNFAGKVITLDIEALRTTSVPNPLGKAPKSWMVFGSKLPLVIQGEQFDKDFLTFTSLYGRDGIIGTSISFNTGTNEIQFTGTFQPIFYPGMEVVFRLNSGSMPGGIVAGQRYWVKSLGGGQASNFTLSAAPGGPTLDITSAGSGDIRVAARGTVKILLLR